MPSRLLISAALLLALLPACGGSEPVAAPRILVFQDGTVPDSRSVVTPAVLGLTLALEGSGVAVQVVDASSPDRSLAAALEAAGDPEVRGAVVAPFAAPPRAAVDSLLRSGVPVLSLSWMDEAAGSGWRRLVDPAMAQGEALAATSATMGDRACLSGDDSPSSRLLTERTAWALEDGGQVGLLAPGSPAEAAESAGRQGCDVVVWTGSAEAAAVLGELLGPGVSLLLGDRARTDGSLEASWPRDEAVAAVCSCVDLSTSANPAAQAFVHDYQEFTGLDAGPWAAEGFDAGAMLLNGGPGRFEGLGGGYAWGREGDLAVSRIRIYEAVGVRWHDTTGGAG